MPPKKIPSRSRKPAVVVVVHHPGARSGARRAPLARGGGLSGWNAAMSYFAQQKKDNAELARLRAAQK